MKFRANIPTLGLNSVFLQPNLIKLSTTEKKNQVVVLSILGVIYFLFVTFLSESGVSQPGVSFLYVHYFGLLCIDFHFPFLSPLGNAVNPVLQLLLVPCMLLYMVPLTTSNHSDMLFPTITLCLLFSSQFLSQSRSLSSIPYPLSLRSRSLCETLSKALA